MRLVIRRPTGRSADRKLHLKGCALPQRRFNPDATTVHLDDLLCNGEPETRAALCLRVGVVDLLALLEDALQFVCRYSGTRVRHGNREVTVHGCRGDTHFASVGKLDRVT